MKKKILIILISFLFISCSNKIVEGKSAGNLKIGNKISDFSVKRYLLKNIIITKSEDNRITDIILFDEKYKLENGLSVNSTVEELKEYYQFESFETGNGDFLFGPLHFSGTLAGPPGTKDYDDDIQVGDIGELSFFISDGIVVAIRVYDKDYNSSNL